MPSLAAPAGGRCTRIVVLVLALIPFLLAPAVADASSGQNDLIKVYVVRAPAQNDGVADTLPEIAQRTLDSSARASDIFSLNQGHAQADGGVLTSPGQQLHPGWILRLPPDASGPFVRLAKDTGVAATGGVQIPVVLAVAAGVLIIVATLLIVLRRRTAHRARRFTRAVHAFGDRLAAPGRRRRALRARQELAAAWRADGTSFVAVRAALADAGRVLGSAGAGPIEADLIGDIVRVAPVPDVVPPAPWQRHDDTDAWHIPRWTRFPPAAPGPVGCRPVLIGGGVGRQTFVDITYCDSALAFTGDRRPTHDVLTALVGNITTYHPDLRVVVLGDVLPGMPAGLPRFRHSSELAIVIGQGRQIIERPVRAAAQRRHITGVIAVPAGTPQQESTEVARLCGSAGSTWLAVFAGEIVGAHWLCHVDRNGTMSVPFLDQTIVATV